MIAMMLSQIFVPAVVTMIPPAQFHGDEVQGTWDGEFHISRAAESPPARDRSQVVQFKAFHFAVRELIALSGGSPRLALASKAKMKRNPQTVVVGPKIKGAFHKDSHST